MYVFSFHAIKEATTDFMHQNQLRRKKK
jgi:3-keto-L-gulonate-6-phosphate decarboxylase